MLRLAPFARLPGAIQFPFYASFLSETDVCVCLMPGLAIVGNEITERVGVVDAISALRCWWRGQAEHQPFAETSTPCHCRVMEQTQVLNRRGKYCIQKCFQSVFNAIMSHHPMMWPNHVPCSMQQGII
ncbi:unnamed protein product [Polarella glacialis]|uniref:Uncharacterized protein n=1 Tax=Polarella glacialis TaxID=89957 RepID=A0A813DGI2_POLGL|nr:unnamed protein product [Polarella glacialis]